MKWLSDFFSTTKKPPPVTKAAEVFKGLPYDASLEPFGLIAFATALDASALISDKWPGYTGGSKMTTDVNWKVRVNILAYVLHRINRFTFNVAGEGLRTRLQDYYTIRLVVSLVESSWQSPEGSDGSFLINLANETMDNVNDCEMRYAGFPNVNSEPQSIERVDGTGVHLIPSEDDFEFGLSVMIAEDTGVELTPALQEMILGSTDAALSKSGFTAYLSTMTQERMFD